VPQGSWLGPLIYLSTQRRPPTSTTRSQIAYVDDTIVTETIEKDSVSAMQRAVATPVEWSELNRMNVNTKEIVMGPRGKVDRL